MHFSRDFSFLFITSNKLRNLCLLASQYFEYTISIMTQAIVLLGKVGHGKTSVINKACGSRFPSGMGARSLTQHVQCAKMTSELSIIDTPGFYASDDVAGHVAAQQVALEEIKLSGIYVVAKCGRADDIAELANTVMDVVGTDDVRIIITHEDVASGEQAFDREELKSVLSNTLGVDTCNIESFGKQASAKAIKSFIARTVHEPCSFAMSKEQIAKAATLAVGSRKINKPINEVFSKIVAAEVACREAISSGRSYASDFIITSTQHATTEMVRTSKDLIFRNTFDMKEEDQNLVYGKAGVALTLRLQAFVETTNQLLSYDITDVSNPQNLVKKCNYCGATWIKTEGCDGATFCGSIPSAVKKASAAIKPEFVQQRPGAFTLVYRYGTEAVNYTASSLSSLFQQLNPFQVSSSGSGSNATHTKREGSIFESGCGMQISWNSMLPVPPEELEQFKTVERLRKTYNEERTKVTFENQMRVKGLENKTILKEALGEAW